MGNPASLLSLLSPLDNESIAKAQHDNPYPPLPPKEANYIQVRAYLFNILTERSHGLATSCPTAIREFINAWYEPGLSLRTIQQDKLEDLCKKAIVKNPMTEHGKQMKVASRASSYVVFDAIYQRRYCEPTKYEKKRAELKEKMRDLEDEMKLRDVYEREKDHYETVLKEYRKTHPKHKKLHKLAEKFRQKQSKLKRTFGGSTVKYSPTGKENLTSEMSQDEKPFCRDPPPYGKKVDTCPGGWIWSDEQAD
ncbi:hypothetical protein NA57DRAFT_70512 [Rhizodiscina lignyota]|uniref:Uncharacterized protein n=1 Tax=Rhizodiscina lignyota TaxID=1504668 RepID=A0A9P4IMK4_9PEZI|nr:hypothetical protein NA57DRAFT_70512 [Rhizodiscina lignyota]